MTSLYGGIVLKSIIEPEPIVEIAEVEIITQRKIKMVEYEILVESFDGIIDKQVFMIESIEKVLLEIKILFNKGFKVVKIKNISNPIVAPEKPFKF